jgi:hypothetical protein
MKAADVFADLRRASASAGCIFINPPTSTPADARERAANALNALDRAARLPRHPALDVEKIARAADVADRAADAVEALARSSTCPLDRVVIFAPAAELRARAANARLAIDPCPTFQRLADVADDRAAEAFALARRVTGC